MSSGEDWLPRRAREASGTLGDVTPGTVPGAALNDVAPDDPAVVALTSPLSPLAEPLPPLDDEFVTPVHIIDLANLDPDRVNAKLAASARDRDDDAPSQSERLFALELANTKLRLDVENLTAMVKDLLRRSAG